MPYRVLFSTWALPTQPCPNPKCDEGASEAGLPYGVLVKARKMPGNKALHRFNSSAAPISRFVFAVRCAILSPMHVIWFRAEYRPSPSGVPWRSLPHPANSESLNLLSLFVSLCRAGSRVIPGRFLRRYRALEPRFARRMCNESLDDSDCANN